MKVCFVTGEYPPMQGGVADYTRELATALHNLGVEVSVLTSIKARPDSASASRDTLPAGSSPTDPWPVYPLMDKWNFRSSRHLLSHLHTLQPDVVHIQYETSAYAMHPAINLLPLWLRRQRSRPGIVTTLHDLGAPYLFPKAGQLRHKVNLALIQGSDKTIVTNGEDYLEACVLTQTGSLKGEMSPDLVCPNVHVVPIGSNIRRNPPEGFDRAAWRARLGVPEDFALLSYFGFLNRSKGVETLLEALRALVADRASVKLLMVGANVGDSDPTNIVYTKQILRHIGELGLNAHILWTGYSTPSETSAHLLASDLCVLPFRDGASFRRGTLLAALAHGLPIVSTKGHLAGQEWLRAKSIAQLVDGEHALLVAPNDSAELAKAIWEMLRQPELRERLGAAARVLAEDFTWPLIAQRTLAIYEEILER